MSATYVPIRSGWQVPAFHAHEITKRSSEYCVCIPVINEGMRLISQLNRIAALELGVDVLIGDGGSRDGSNDPELLSRHGVRTVLVKTGPDVLISVRRAIGGTELGQLHAAVQKEFLTLDENEQSVRIAVAKLETGFLRRFATLQHE